MKPLLISSGEPAGIGPDICLEIASLDMPLVVLGDWDTLAQRAKQLNLSIQLEIYNPNLPVVSKKNTIRVIPIPGLENVIPGQLDARYSRYVIDMLTRGVALCLSGEFSGLVTAPVHKGILNDAGFHFTGHTEFLASHCQTPHVVMMLVSKTLRIALVTTHLPLRSVADNITQERVVETVMCLERSLKNTFGIAAPKIYMSGLNPHAGESGHLGLEEIEVIEPAIKRLKIQGIDVSGPFPADTLFLPKYIEKADAFVLMYHDQGLPVIKYGSFGEVVNVTLGLPIIRTSVDHGTAVEFAGSGRAKPDSLIAAIETAHAMAQNKEKSNGDA